MKEIERKRNTERYLTSGTQYEKKLLKNKPKYQHKVIEKV